MARQAERYRKGYVRTQRFALLTSPVSELFGAAVVMLILWAASNQAVSGVTLGGAEDGGASSSRRSGSCRRSRRSPRSPSQLAMAEASAERIFAYPRHAGRCRAGSRPARRRPRSTRDLVFDRVTFGTIRPHAGAAGRLLQVRQGRGRGAGGADRGGEDHPAGTGARASGTRTAGEIRLDGVPLTRLSRARSAA